jgi:hypothetical protein
MGRRPRPWEQEGQEPLAETNYFVFFSTVDKRSAKITSGPRLPPLYDNWRSGRRIDIAIPTPLVYEIEPDDEGTLRPYFRELGAPLMSDDLIAVLRTAGVDNLDTYDAVIREVRTGREHRNYKAVNIVGLVDGADLAKSKYTTSGLSGDPIVNVWFEKLVLDEAKLAGNLFFRLAQNVGMVLAHKRVVDAINAANLPGRQYLEFAHPGEFRG